MGKALYFNRYRGFGRGAASDAHCNEPTALLRQRDPLPAAASS